MSTDTETALDLRPGSRGQSAGRKDKDGTEEIPRFDDIKRGCAEMMRAFKKLQTARQAYNDTVKAVAERGNVNAATLKRLVRASAGGNFADEHRKVDQQAIIFDEVGEISDAGAGKE